ncbi:MAG TPA: hypothetical protein VLH77_03160 [Gammaproteobacteria bacterium]|nr:hypothetical protein [Gammaproteobacteria bacterium]
MRKIYKKLKPWGSILVSLSLSTAFFTQTAKADMVDVPYLTNIQNYTNSILNIINQLPTYLADLPILAKTFLAADNASGDPVNWTANWSNEQNWLSTLGGNALSNEANQTALQTSLLTTFFGAAGNPQNINDLSYTTLLGNLLLSPDPRSNANPSLNYLMNAAGLNINYPAPSIGWRGNQQAQKNYTQFYNTIISVQTYNAYVLSRLYADSQTLATDNSLRKQLITQSSNSSWFTSVITNDLGWVFRQILLYSSQNYVLMDQLVQSQKQMTAALAMTNALLIANSGFQASTLLSKAQGGA